MNILISGYKKTPNHQEDVFFSFCMFLFSAKHIYCLPISLFDTSKSLFAYYYNFVIYNNED